MIDLKPKKIIGSSTAGISIAEKIKINLSTIGNCYIWNDPNIWKPIKSIIPPKRRCVGSSNLHAIKMKNILIFIMLLTSLNACNNKLSKENINTTKSVQMIDSVQIEVDEIFSLLTYSIVLKYWVEDDRKGRGYNVASILVSPQNEVLDWGINTVNKTENCTQHGEVRLMTRYLDKEGIYSLQDHCIYSTLEPCAMCAGMMTIASIKKTVNGQKDYYFSKALERLAFNSEPYGGYPPYPRVVLSQETPSKFGKILDEAYQEYIKAGNKPIITKFLSTSKAKEIFQDASNAFLSYKIIHVINNNIIEKAKIFYNQLPNEPK